VREEHVNSEYEETHGTCEERGDFRCRYSFDLV
jgi:hypothetical protein